MPLAPRSLHPMPGGFDPRRIGAVALWLDGTVRSSLTLNGTTVSQWNDLSGNGRHATQTTAASQPSATATINGRAAVGGNNGWMTIAATPLVFPATVLIAGQAPNGNTAFFQVGAVNGAYSMLSSTISSAERISARRSSSFQSTATHPAATRAAVYAGLYGAILSRMVVDGVAATDNASSFTPTAGDYAWTLFRLGATNFASAVTIGELIVYPKLLTAPERQTVERYLAAKWRIPTA